ncbi:Esterase [Echinococcus multilocularis]|uniref:Esterase n=1 Tax=Echinococcus multilocularis TaxID=6211 RepID=A0A0S4MNS2_ECHMU|nr:Esterase [Echinococcus multilocularis]
MAAAQALTGGWNLPKQYGDQAERPPKSVSRAPSGMPGASSGKPDFFCEGQVGVYSPRESQGMPEQTVSFWGSSARELGAIIPESLGHEGGSSFFSLGRGAESSLDWAVARGLQEEVRFGGGPPHRESGLLWLASAPGLGEEGGHLGLSASGCGL